MGGPEANSRVCQISQALFGLRPSCVGNALPQSFQQSTFGFHFRIQGLATQVDRGKAHQVEVPWGSELGVSKTLGTDRSLTRWTS